MAGFDAVFVGSGINSLAGGALLAKEGWRVCVLERNDWLGGAIKTVDGLTAPGFTHEVFSSWHPLWVGSPAYAELKPDLDALGLEYLNTDLPTAAAFPDGSSAFLSTDGAANVAELGDAWQRQFDEFMAGAEIAFGVLGTELWSGAGLSLGRKAYSHYGRRGLVEFAGHTLLSARDWLTETFEDERTRGLLAPWVLHTGLGPDQAVSGFMTQVIACALQLGGMPVPKGGGTKLVEGLATIIRNAGGELRTEADVERILVSEGRATAVRLADGESISASRAVLACVTPTQLYGRLLGESDAPTHVRDAARRFRYGRGEMQIHIAMNELPRWQGDERLARTPLLHLTPGLDGVSRAVNEADRGLLPAEATIALGQPMALDPSRAPEGSWVIWVQLQELPPRPKGDAAGELDVRATARGRRSCARRTPTGSSSGSAATSRTSSPRPSVGSSCRLPTWRTRTRTGSAATSMPARARSTRTSSSAPRPPRPATERRSSGLWHIGASTHPGPGLGAGSGYIVAKHLTRPPLRRRLLAKLPGVAVMLSLSEISTASASFRDDLRAYAAAGFDGIGIWEMKLGANDEANLEAVRASGLSVTNCVPLVPSILPNTVIEGPEDVETRIESLCASVRRFAPFEPDCVLCLTGPAGERSEEEARRLVIDGLRRIAAAADEAGVRLGLEPIHASERDALTLITSIPEALELLDEAGLPNVGIMVDLWHLWDTPDDRAPPRRQRRPDHRRARRELVRAGSAAIARCRARASRGPPS